MLSLGISCAVVIGSSYVCVLEDYSKKQQNIFDIFVATPCLLRRRKHVSSPTHDNVDDDSQAITAAGGGVSDQAAAVVLNLDDVRRGLLVLCSMFLFCVCRRCFGG